MQNTIEKEGHICFFCEDYVEIIRPYHNHIEPIRKYQNIWVCTEDKVWDLIGNCYKFGEQCKHMTQNKECPVCLSNKDLIKLPTCSHELCLDCCKTIYFGYCDDERPLSWSQVEDESQGYNDISNEQFDYYIKNEFHVKANELVINNKTKTLEELLKMRDSLISERPKWMNTDYFIEFENKVIKYYRETAIADINEEEYRTKMVVGNKCCPFCRANP